MAITAFPPGRTDHPAVRAPEAGPTGRLARVLRGRASDPAWVRPALLTLLAGTAVLYLWGLGRSGYANTFYAGAVQAGTKSWKAFFFGSSDAANFITVDKPPAALWVMEISARIFGLNSWSLLVPQALEGVAAVAVLYATLRRWVAAGPALLGGAVLALTPAATLMFRFNNPDALLVLLLVVGAYATVRAIEGGSTRWLMIAGLFVGFGFVAKMLQAFIVVPALGGAYLLAAPPRLRRRVGQLAVAGVAMAAAAAWWVVAVQLTPAADRPYVGGSQDNSLWNLIFGYNGFGRLTGNENGSVGGGAAGTSGRWGITGLTRMFNADFGAQASWLLPACGILLVAGLVWTIRRPRTDRVRAGIVVWGGWVLVTAAVFSLGQGIIHPYYTVALAPGIGGMVATGVALLWSRRTMWQARAVLAGTVAVTTWWAWVLLGRDASWHPELRTGIIAAGALSIIGLLGWVPGLRRAGTVLGAVGALAVAAGVAAPAAYSLQTASTAHSGAIPSAGPAGSGFGSGGPAGAGRARGGFGARGAFGGARGAFGGTRGGFVPPAGGVPSGGGVPSAGGFGVGGTPPAGRPRGGSLGGMLGGLLGGSSVSPATAKALAADASAYTWVVATAGSEQAAAYQLATGDPVMAIGGFNGTDPAPSLTQFEAYVTHHRIHYFIAGGGFGGGGGGGGGGGAGTAGTVTVASQIAAWVEGHYTSTTVGGVTVYDLTQPAG
ncbi:glycosyltransferase family 39 protein [Acidiferrimicrobium sp. IK]|uniref:glycosyltransferase family 39 protein n=1 Tax=Acidiferrimicrobium sp. IK TaxID=2871700 RepID=UPI0021CB1DBD|nr:glycosyltransferase family 39 protein [Acidiferrimicrobium sp. IK]MCU4184116.1 glycosyltransferase family 39 protein [Acidiferrimicrobium sp. IK]